MAQARTGTNLFLAATLAALCSLAPFEWVAKGSLLISLVLLILDPVPPFTRLMALIIIILVSLLTKAHQQSQEVVGESEVMTVEHKSTTKVSTKEMRRRSKED